MAALGRELLHAAGLRTAAEADALHIAIAVVHEVDFLLTWNARHIAGSAVRRRVEAACRARGYAAPVLCTPEELMNDPTEEDWSNERTAEHE